MGVVNNNPKVDKNEIYNNPNSFGHFEEKNISNNARLIIRNNNTSDKNNENSQMKNEIFLRDRAQTDNQIKDNKILILEKEEEIKISIKNQDEMTSKRIQEANDIGYKNFPESIYETDQFGFLVDLK